MPSLVICARAIIPMYVKALQVREGPNIYIRTHITKVDITRDADRIAHAYGYETDYYN